MKDRLITLATDHYTAAEIIRARLEASGIKVVLKHVNLIQGAVSEGVKIQIHESDVEKALQLMSHWKTEQEESSKRDVRKIRRILVAVDFSADSMNACMYALNLAARYKAELKILHVYYAPIVDLVPITDAYSIQIDMDVNLREMESNVKRELLAFVAKVRAQAQNSKAAEVVIGYSLREGIAEDEIARMASDYKPGIVVLGSKGRGEKQGDLVGSVVNRLIDRTDVPVLAIPGKSVYDGSMQVKNVLYATDFDDSDYLAIRRLLGILSAFDIRLFCVHVSRPSGQSWDSIKMEALSDYLKSVHSGLDVSCHLLEGEDILKQLDIFARNNNINLLALTKRKRGFFFRLFNPSLAQKIIIQGDTPVLVFRSR